MRVKTFSGIKALRKKWHNQYYFVQAQNVQPQAEVENVAATFRLRRWDHQVTVTPNKCQTAPELSKKGPVWLTYGDARKIFSSS